MCGTNLCLRTLHSSLKFVVVLLRSIHRSIFSSGRSLLPRRHERPLSNVHRRSAIVFDGVEHGHSFGDRSRVDSDEKSRIDRMSSVVRIVLSSTSSMSGSTSPSDHSDAHHRRHQETKRETQESQVEQRRSSKANLLSRPRETHFVLLEFAELHVDDHQRKQRDSGENGVGA
jgi:hypothetical protein